MTLIIFPFLLVTVPCFGYDTPILNLSSTELIPHTSWTWIGGHQQVNQTSFTLTTSRKQRNHTYAPGSRTGFSYWRTNSSHLWIFGGIGFPQDSTHKAAASALQDIWLFNSHNNRWQGSNSHGPASRRGAAMCGAGDVALAIYGGYDEASHAVFSDTWLYNINHHEWYEPLKILNMLNSTHRQPHPSARKHPAYWCHHHTLYIFSGADKNNALLSDMWKFDMTSSSWQQINYTVLSGGKLQPRISASVWVGYHHQFYLYGGSDAHSTQLYSDLWVFSHHNHTWTFLSGVTSPASQVSYGALGVFSDSNTPGGRAGAAAWTDQHWDLWLYGGQSEPGDVTTGSGLRADLWKFSLQKRQWVWLSGQRDLAARPQYSPSTLTPACPGARTQSLLWRVNDTHFMLYGGLGWDSHAVGLLDDLWTLEVTSRTYSFVPGAQLFAGLSRLQVALLLLTSLAGLTLIPVCAVCMWRMRRPRDADRGHVRYSPLGREAVDLGVLSKHMRTVGDGEDSEEEEIIYQT